MTEEEKDLLERFRAGDPQAFTLLVERYQDRLTGFFFRNCWDRHQAEDLVQEVFIRMIKAADRYVATGRLTTYVFKIARNLWIDRARKNRIRPGEASMDKPMTPDGDPQGAVIAGPGATPPERIVAREEQERLRRAWRQLPEGQRLVFELAVYQELPYREISGLLEIPQGTVKSRMFHALRTLRTIREKEEESPSRRRP